MRSQESVKKELNNVKEQLTQDFSEGTTKSLRQQYRTLSWVLEPEEEEEEGRRR